MPKLPWWVLALSAVIAVSTVALGLAFEGELADRPYVINLLSSLTGFSLSVVVVGSGLNQLAQRRWTGYLASIGSHVLFRLDEWVRTIEYLQADFSSYALPTGRDEAAFTYALGVYERHVDEFFRTPIDDLVLRLDDPECTHAWQNLRIARRQESALAWPTSKPLYEAFFGRLRNEEKLCRTLHDALLQVGAVASVYRGRRAGADEFQARFRAIAERSKANEAPPAS